MKLTEFLVKWRESTDSLKQEYNLEIVTRINDSDPYRIYNMRAEGSGVDCPITGLCYLTTGHEGSVARYFECGNSLGLPGKLIDTIVEAADFTDKGLNLDFIRLRQMLKWALGREVIVV